MGWFRAEILLGLALCAPSAANPVPEITPSQANRIAACMGKQDAEHAGAYAAALPGSAKEAEALPAFNALVEGCGRGKIEPTEQNRFWIAGAFAEQRRFHHVRFMSNWSPAELDNAEYSEQLLRNMWNWPKEVAVVSCTAARDPRTAEALLGTKPDSANEKQAIERLAPVFARCVETGSQMGFARRRVRAIIARYRYGRFTVNPEVEYRAYRQ